MLLGDVVRDEGTGKSEKTYFRGTGGNSRSTSWMKAFTANHDRHQQPRLRQWCPLTQGVLLAGPTGLGD